MRETSEPWGQGSSSDEDGAGGQGHTTFPGTGSGRVRQEQRQRLAEDWSKRQKSFCWQDLSWAGPSGKNPRNRNHSCQKNGTTASFSDCSPRSAQAHTLLPSPPPAQRSTTRPSHQQPLHHGCGCGDWQGASTLQPAE